MVLLNMLVEALSYVWWPPEHTCLFIIAFLIPTYMFIGTLLFVIGLGAFRMFSTHGHPVPVIAPPHLPIATSMLSL